MDHKELISERSYLCFSEFWRHVTEWYAPDIARRHGFFILKGLYVQVDICDIDACLFKTTAFSRKDSTNHAVMRRQIAEERRTQLHRCCERLKIRRLEICVIDWSAQGQGPSSVVDEGGSGPSYLNEAREILRLSSHCVRYNNEGYKLSLMQLVR
jgi:hypothetical protein